MKGLILPLPFFLLPLRLQFLIARAADKPDSELRPGVQTAAAACVFGFAGRLFLPRVLIAPSLDIGELNPAAVEQIGAGNRERPSFFDVVADFLPDLFAARRAGVPFPAVSRDETCL